MTVSREEMLALRKAIREAGRQVNNAWCGDIYDFADRAPDKDIVAFVTALRVQAGNDGMVSWSDDTYKRARDLMIEKLRNRGWSYSADRDAASFDEAFQHAVGILSLNAEITPTPEQRRDGEPIEAIVQRIKEACAQVADRAAISDEEYGGRYADERDKYGERAHRARTIAASIRALIPSPASEASSPPTHSKLRQAVLDIIEANQEFLAGMPDEWEGDPLQDAIQVAEVLLSREEQAEASK